MTILVFDIHVPEIYGAITNQSLWSAIKHSDVLFMSYFLSFALLFTYWCAHHFITSVYAKNIDIKLTNINALFLFFVAMVPFSAHLLGLYSTVQVAIVVFAVHVICIGLTLFWLRRYVEVAEVIENTRLTPVERRHSYIRVLFPVFTAIVAIGFSFLHKELSLTLLTLGILFNLLPKSTTIISWFIDPFLAKK